MSQLLAKPCQAYICLFQTAKIWDIVAQKLKMLGEYGIVSKALLALTLVGFWHCWHNPCDILKIDLKITRPAPG